MISSEGDPGAVLRGEARWAVGNGDCLEFLRELPDNSCDACVTDPPAGIGFMGKDWDKPSRAPERALVVSLRRTLGEAAHPRDRRLVEREMFVEYLAERFDEAYRVLKPGAHLLVWGLPRTEHWTALAIEYAGFEIFDSIEHLFSQGSAKSKSARRMLAMARCELPGRHFESALPKKGREDGDHVCAEHAEPTDWDGHGTGLAPSHESWILARKPLEGTIAENIEAWGTGVLDIDGARIPSHSEEGRWPKNVIFSHEPGCRLVGTALVEASPTWDTPNRATRPALFTGAEVSKTRHVSSREGEPTADKRYTGRGSASLSKTPGRRRPEVEEVDVWRCVPGCSVFALHEQGGERTSSAVKLGVERGAYSSHRETDAPGRAERPIERNSGAVTRYYLCLPRTEPGLEPFVYQPKPNREEKEAGLSHFRARSAAEATGSKDDQARLENPRTGAGRTGDVKNVHGTVKSEDLLRYFVRLVCPKGGVVVDLFAGAGTVGAAAVKEQRRFIGYELYDSDEEPHASIARARIHYADGAGELVPRESLRPAVDRSTMFGAG